MNNLNNFLSFFLPFLFVFFFNISFSQDNNLTTMQDSRFEKLLNEKRKINASLIMNENFKIQIFNGDSENAKKNLIQFRKDYKNLDATVIFNTPSYKVIAGNFKSRMEAERNLIEVRKLYKNALLIRPKG